MAVRLGAALVTSALLGLSSFAIGPAAYAAGPPSPPVSPPAQPTPPANGNSTTYSILPTPFSLTISPTRLVVAPEDIGAPHQILVVNRGQQSAAVTVQKRNFVGNRNGSLQFQETAEYSASDWITVEPSSFVLASGASIEVTETITVPSIPEPGDHEVALVFLVPAGQTEANIKINRGVATPVYITVAGPTTDTALISNFRAPDFAIGGPVRLTATVHDTGSVHRDFRGKTGLTTSGAGSATFPDFTVMRGSTRDLSTTWSPPLVCICHPTVAILNADGTTSSATVQVIVVPLAKLALLLAAGVVFMAIMIVRRRRFHTKVNRAAAALTVSASNTGA